MLGSYRAVLGHFELDQWFMVVSAAVNLVLSFALFIPFGIAGALAATVVAHAIMWAGRVKVVCRLYMTGALGRYLRVQAAHLLTLGRLHGRDILGLRAAARRGLRLCRPRGRGGAAAKPAEPCLLCLDLRCGVSARVCRRVVAQDQKS